MHKIYWVHLYKVPIDNILGTVYNNLNIKQNNPNKSNRVDNSHKSVLRTCEGIARVKPIDTQVVQRLLQIKSEKETESCAQI